MLIYRLLKGDTYLTKEASKMYLGSNCKHSLNFTCHAYKRNATEVTKILVKTFLQCIYMYV